MTEHAYAWKRTSPPRVPTSDEIAGDIARRKRKKENAHTLNQGAYDICQGMHTSLNKTTPTIDKFKAAMQSLTHVTSKKCKDRDSETFTDIMKVFPDLVQNDSFSDETWSGLERMFALNSMESNIPVNMMTKIEDVASQLVEEIANGKTSMDALNVESIGQQVLAHVSKEEVEQFAGNIDKILPALNSMGASLPKGFT